MTDRLLQYASGSPEPAGAGARIRFNERRSPAQCPDRRPSAQNPRNRASLKNPMVRKVADLSAVIASLVVAVPGCLLGLERQQLPAGVTPISYDLSLVPDETNLRFGGQVRIML